MTLQRRGFLTGLAAALAAPAIIRTPGLLMPVKRLAVIAPWVEMGVTYDDFIPTDQLASVEVLVDSYSWFDHRGHFNVSTPLT